MTKRGKAANTGALNGERVVPNSSNVAVARKPAQQTSVLLAWTLLTLACLFWAGSSVAGRAAAGHVPPMALSFWRWAIAFAIFLPLCAGSLAQKRRVLARSWMIIGVLGALGIFGFSAPYYIGLKYTTALNSSLFNATAPIMIVVITFVWLRMRVTAVQLFGVLLGFAGTVMIAAQGDWQILAGLDFNPGDLLMLVAYLSWSLYTVVLRWAPKELGQLELTCMLAGVGVICFAPLYVWEISQGLGFVLNTANIAIILYSAVFPSFLAYVFWNLGVAAIGPNQAGYSQYLVPPFGIVLASAILGETVEPFHWVGIVIIFVGVWFATRRSNAAAH